jgi:uncharacterized protein
VFTLSTLVIIALIALAAGTLIGIAVGRSWVPPAHQKALEQRLSSTQDELNNYQQEVAQHFIETSMRVSELTQSYRDLHEHLAKGAMKLTNTDIGRELLNAGVNNEAIADLEDMSIEPPRDWAPKVPGARGMLSEEFGLKEHDDHPEYSSPIKSRG